MAVREAFLRIYRDRDWICSGGCLTGGDRFARLLWKEFATPYLEFPPQWKKHGKAAAFIRNRQVAAVCDILIACHDKSASVMPDTEGRGSGTMDTVTRFLEEHPRSALILV
jgi:hypothetical protein